MSRVVFLATACLVILTSIALLDRALLPGRLPTDAPAAPAPPTATGPAAAAETHPAAQQAWPEPVSGGGPDQQDIASTIGDPRQYDPDRVPSYQPDELPLVGETSPGTPQPYPENPYRLPPPKPSVRASLRDEAERTLQAQFERYRIRHEGERRRRMYDADAVLAEVRRDSPARPPWLASQSHWFRCAVCGKVVYTIGGMGGPGMRAAFGPCLAKRDGKRRSGHRWLPLSDASDTKQDIDPTGTRDLGQQ